MVAIKVAGKHFCSVILQFFITQYAVNTPVTANLIFVDQIIKILINCTIKVPINRLYKSTYKCTIYIAMCNIHIATLISCIIKTTKGIYK